MYIILTSVQWITIKTFFLKEAKVLFWKPFCGSLCVWKSSRSSKSRTVIRQKQDSKEHHINIAKACKAELVSTYERKPWHSPITLPLSATRANQPCATITVSIRHYCLWLNVPWNRKVISLRQRPWDVTIVGALRLLSRWHRTDQSRLTKAKHRLVERNERK